MFGAALHGIFVIIILGEPALLLPEIAKTPSRGPLSPLYGGKEGVLRGGWLNCNRRKNKDGRYLQLLVTQPIDRDSFIGYNIQVVL